jgi:hypothetical protein
MKMYGTTRVYEYDRVRRACLIMFVYMFGDIASTCKYFGLHCAAQSGITSTKCVAYSLLNVLLLHGASLFTTLDKFLVEALLVVLRKCASQLASVWQIGKQMCGFP